MKSISLFITVASLSLASCAQNISSGKVPSVVQNAVQTKFASASNIEWEKKNNIYEAEFDMANTEYNVYVDESGKLIAHKLDILENELPPVVVAAINLEHPGYLIDDADRIEKDGITYYQVELDAKGKKDIQAVYSQDGKIAVNIPFIQ